MKLRDHLSLWRKLAEKPRSLRSGFPLPRCYANVTYVTGKAAIAFLPRIPSLFRGPALSGAAPVFLTAPSHDDARTSPIPRNLPLPMVFMCKRPRRTDHV